VITLLMTFFILLLTFATNEPESFERMQVSMFSGGGASGIAGPSQTPTELDSIIMRVRSRAGRLTTRGSEIPPSNRDPSLRSLAKGLQGLEDDERRQLSSQHSATIALAELVNQKGEVTAMGNQQLKMLARNIRRRPFDVKLVASNQKDMEKAHILAWSLYEDHGVEIEKIAVGRSTAWSRNEPSVTFLLNNPLEQTQDGSQD
ncbi:MAG: flagellar motor protein MotB, partial [Planctomycetales bacterium]|nr:flagellar motor protein MotB [Planctomycetales bacterium]